MWRGVVRSEYGGRYLRLVAIDDFFPAYEKPTLLSRDRVRRAVIRRCAVCGCSDGRACAGGCWWTTATTCSSCLYAPPGLVSAFS